MKLLDGKVALITGSGRGIGTAAAMLYAAHGAKVVVSDLDPEPAEATAEKIRQAGGTSLVVPADVTDEGEIEELIGQTVAAFGGIDILVNNAGYTWDSMAHKVTDDQWEAMLAVHLTAPFKIIRACIPHMREVAKREMDENGQAKFRKIINIARPGDTRPISGRSIMLPVKLALSV